MGDRLMDRLRFVDLIDASGEAGCWPWLGSPGRIYGRQMVDGVRHPAHRLSYETFVGPIPAGLTIDHLCRNTRCVNPAHMEPVPMSVNLARSNFGCAVNRRKTHCVAGHPLSGYNLLTRADGRRNCRACQNRRKAEFLARRRAS